ncbi:MAG: siderophore-interacting protein [Actinomycetota bacterium]
MYGEVQTTEWLSPSMVRVVLGGGDLDGYASTGCTDEYINAAFPPVGAPYQPPYETDDLDGVEPELRPRPRRYTVRRWDDAAKQLTVDFVAHGDEGFAGPWAQRAQPGDRLQFKGPGGGYSPNPDADWYLFAGDESALPAIGASLERLGPDARGVALIVVDGPQHEFELQSPDGVEVRWLHRREVDDPAGLLVDTVTALEIPTGTLDLFVHGEAGEVRDVRRHLANDRGVEVNGASISPYWRRNYTDEDWRAVKAAWTAEMRAETAG